VVHHRAAGRLGPVVGEGVEVVVDPGGALHRGAATRVGEAAGG
jgi:hypothetical protein